MWVTKDGRAQETITDPHTGLKKTLTVKLSGTGEKAKQEAFKRLQERIDKISDPHVLLSSAIDTYIQESERELKPSSVRKMRIELNQFLKVVGDADMDALTAGYIRTKLIKSGKENRTLNGYMKIFKTFWLWAYRNDYVKSREVFDKLSPFADQPKRQRIQDKFLETEELSLLLNAMKEERWKLVTELLALSGLRVGELAAMVKTDISGDYIHVTKTYDANNRVVTSAKSYDSIRDIYIQEELKDCIVRINDYQRRQAEIWGYTTILFFPDIDGDYMRYDAYRKYLRENSEKVLGRKIVPHTLRHTHCSMLAMKGMSLDAISARLGHGDSRITKEIYLHRMAELKEKENRQLDSIRILGN